jgi:protein tyrosine/serine phosphatase
MIRSFGLKRLMRSAGIGLLSALLLGAAYLAALRLTGNFNTVIDREFYRSGQITAQQLNDYVERYGIKTIVNLRGVNAGTSWYDKELAESRRLNVNHIDFGLSARQELSVDRARELIAVLRSAPKPILVHCEGGADRSGLTSALYLAVLKNSTTEVAERQLSIRFGHFSLPFISEYAMNRSFTKLEPSLRLPAAQ